MSTIVISCGQIEGRFVRQVRDAAIKQGFRDGLFLAFLKFQPSIAKRTGAMRKAFGRAIIQIMERAHVSHSGQISVSWAEIKAIVIQYTFYAEYHFRARGFYKNPTTANTRPMRFRAFKYHAVRLITRKIQTNFALVGLEATNFSVS